MNQFCFEFPRTNHRGKSGSTTKAAPDCAVLHFADGQGEWGGALQPLAGCVTHGRHRVIVLQMRKCRN